MRRVALPVAALAFLAFFLSPLAWQAVTSLWPEAELGAARPSALSLASWRAVLADPAFLRALANSALVAAAATAAALVVATPAAFALAKLPFRGAGLLLAAALAAALFPPVAVVSPLYLALRAVGLLDRLGALVVPDAAFALPLALWLLTATFRALPDAVYRAALADGCTPLQAFRWVLLPLAGPGVATAGIMVFIATWNEFLFALTFVVSPDRRTAPVAIALYAGEHGEPWGIVAAASLLAIAPVGLLALAFQRRIVAGLTAGAVKG